jgi:hypothetical protein
MATSKRRSEWRKPLQEVYNTKGPEGVQELKTKLSGYGLSNPGAIPATGQTPQVNPFIIPKATGLNVVSQAYPNNYYVEWNPTTWRAACDQAIKLGWPISYAALTAWAFESSPFIQSLFREITVSTSGYPIVVYDNRGNKVEEWTDEICNKAWFKKLRTEMLLSWFWGFSIINFDPLGNKSEGIYPDVYKYPMQQIDPINRMLRVSSYDFGNGKWVKDCKDLLFCQPSTNYESFLGWMQPITRSYIMMNLNRNNWVAAGKRIAFPLMTAGYPQNSVKKDENGNDYNEYRAQAEAIIRDADPTNGVVYPYTISASGEIQKAVMIDYTSGSQGTQGAHRIYHDFNQNEKDDIREMIMLSTLTSSVGSRGSLALGEIHENKFELVKLSLIEWLVSELNNEFKEKIKVFYKNFPKECNFGLESVKKWDIKDLEIVSNIAKENGFRLSKDVFLSIGLSVDQIEEVSVPVEDDNLIESKTKESSGRGLFGLKKKLNS